MNKCKLIVYFATRVYINNNEFIDTANGDAQGAGAAPEPAAAQLEAPRQAGAHHGPGVDQQREDHRQCSGRIGLPASPDPSEREEETQRRAPEGPIIHSGWKGRVNV